MNNKTLKKYKKLKNIKLNVVKKTLKKKHKKLKNIKLNILNNKTMRFNEEFIKILTQMSDLLRLKGEPFRARAYQKAIDSLILYDDDITEVEQIKNMKGIGKTILSKLKEYVDANGLEKCIKDYQGERQKYYEKLSTFSTFGKGWTRRVDETTELALSMIS